MKKIVAIAMTLIVCYPLSIGAQPDDREIDKGTVLNYTIKEGTISYKLKITVIDWDMTFDSIVLQWQTTGAKSMKGICRFPYESLFYSKEMKIKLKPGNETLTEFASRWFAGYDVFNRLYETGIEADLIMDGKKSTLLPNEDQTEKEILYDNVKIEMAYGLCYNEDEKIKIGFIECNPGIIIMSDYSKGNYSMILTSIQSPVPKTPAGH